MTYLRHDSWGQSQWQVGGGDTVQSQWVTSQE